MVLNVEVCKGLGVPTHKLDMEMVERKGKGHPDVICDRAAEELSVALSRYYLEKTEEFCITTLISASSLEGSPTPCSEEARS